MLRALLKLLLGLLFRVSVTGHGSQLVRGRPLVLANHDSLIDPLLVALFLPGRPLIVLPQVVMFPQERATTTGSTMKVYGAAGVVAVRADADVIPLRIQGTLYTRWAATSARWPRRWLQRVVLVIQPSTRFSRPAVSTSSGV